MIRKVVRGSDYQNAVEERGKRGGQESDSQIAASLSVITIIISIV
jgi:hypothetical protein